MFENYRTVGWSWVSSLNVHECQHYTMCNNISDVYELPRWPMIMFLYYSSILDIYSFMFSIKSMIVNPSPNSKGIT